MFERPITTSCCCSGMRSALYFLACEAVLGDHHVTACHKDLAHPCVGERGIQTQDHQPRDCPQFTAGVGLGALVHQHRADRNVMVTHEGIQTCLKRPGHPTAVKPRVRHKSLLTCCLSRLTLGRDQI